MKFNKYFFENFSIDTPFDIKNPRYVLSLDGVDKVLEKIIKNQPYTLTIEDFRNTELVNALLYIDILQQNKGKLGMAVPFFVDEDASILMDLSKRVANNIATELIAHKEQIFSIIECIDNGYSAERNLYHILCGYIFDGLMFNYLEENQLVTTSYIHKSGLDYLVILYEDTKSLNEYSNLLLCSYNRLTINGKGFVSFGDSNGSRKDFYRYKRKNELNLLTEQEREYINYSTEDLIQNFNRLLDGKEIAPEYMKVYEYFGYTKEGRIDIPIYNSSSYDIANKLYHFVLNTVEEKIADALFAIQSEDRLLSIAHKVNIKDIANEVYHLIFGEVNGVLIENKLIDEPPYLQDEGKYLKSFER